MQISLSSCLFLFLDKVETKLPFSINNHISKLIHFNNFYLYSTNNLLLRLKQTDLLSVLQFVKYQTQLQYSLLTAISAVDFPFRECRFCIVYELLSIKNNSRLRIKTFVDEISPVESAVSVFSSATWWEREIWDLFGVFFVKNSEIKRILTDYGFEGHPLRKDFPLSGYTEMRYVDNLKRVTCEPIEHSQELRLSSISSTWYTKSLENLSFSR
jgi:NADH dehydrogenase (ubiquinone) Fe-S protein 3